ncbi:amino acid transporter [Polycladomyces sp. WAk]|uniref:Amino acid transporter n=1 Tax=Polycladomyces zharkentensis TaxID=2807616 RepID=A0ABS2WIX4_9BACL|nr:LysE/ArgO family amino acid transporter [Polycladomyces sp. WAk]MBN2909512.1 amino acid transporter [Polycladomyces sp. WAk]
MIGATLHGLVLAFGLIIPLGAQNVFVFNQGAVQSRFLRVLPVIITASICDTLLIVAAVLGVSFVILTVSWLQFVLFGIGIFFLLYMGLSVWRSHGGSPSHREEEVSPKKQIAFAASVSLLNPHAILDTVGVIGTNSLSYTGTEKMAFTLACIFVSWAWFFGLAIAGRIVGNIDRTGTIVGKINKLSALIIWGVALYLIYQLFWGANTG